MQAVCKQGRRNIALSFRWLEKCRQLSFRFTFALLHPRSALRNSCAFLLYIYTQTVANAIPRSLIIKLPWAAVSVLAHDEALPRLDLLAHATDRRSSREPLRRVHSMLPSAASGCSSPGRTASAYVARLG